MERLTTFPPNLETLSMLASGLLGLIAVVHIFLALGVRRGELVWTGRHPRRLDTRERWRSALFALLLVASAVAILFLSGTVEFEQIPERWERSIGFVVTAFLGLSALASSLWGSRWERYLFGPIMLFGTGLTGYLAFG